MESKQLTIPDELQEVLSSDLEIMGGAICFQGTRIPVSILLDNIRASVPMDVFFDAYPDLTHEQVQVVIDWEDSQARKALGLKLVS